MQQRSAKSGKYSPFVRGLSLIGSIGMLSSGMVWAQTQTSPNADVDPAAYEPPQTVEAVSAPQAAAAPEPETAAAALEAAPVAPEPATSSAAALEAAPVAPEPATSSAAALEAAPVAPEPATSSTAAPAPVWEEPSHDARKLLPATSSTAAPMWEKPTEQAPQANPAVTAVEGWAPEVAAPAVPQAPIPEKQQLAKPAPELAVPEPATASAQTFEDYNNLYIDPSGYSIGSTSGYEEPSAVILSERSSGTQVVVGAGESVGSRAAGAAVAPSQSYNPEVAIAPAGAAEISQPPAEAYIQYEAVAVNAETLPVPPMAATPPALLGAQPLPVPANARPLPVPANASTPPVPAYAQPKPDRETLAQYPAPSSPQYYPEVSQTALEPIAVGAVSVSDSGIGLNTPPTPPAPALPLPGGFYYQNSLPRPAGVPGNGNTQLLFPLTIPAAITSAFGWRIHPISGGNSFHSGTDLGAPMGTPVLAAYDGKVTTASYLGGYGLTVVMEHDNGTRETLYAHLSDIFVKPGDTVPQGSAIGSVGSTGNSTGPHLHFELRELTASGWVTVDPGAQLEYALAQLVKALQTAQSNPKPKAG